MYYALCKSPFLQTLFDVLFECKKPDQTDWLWFRTYTFLWFFREASRDRDRDKKRDQEDEEEAYERRKLERKLRDKEAAYQEVRLLQKHLLSADGTCSFVWVSSPTS